MLHGIGLLSVAAANWLPTLLVRDYGLGGASAGLVGALAIGLGTVSRPLAGLLVHRRPELVGRSLYGALVTGVAGTLLLAVASEPLLGFIGAALLGFAAGAFFAPAMFGAGRVRSDAPATAVAFINTLGNSGVLVATPLLGLAFAGAGDGRAGFVALALVWALGLAAVPRRRGLGLDPVVVRASGTGKIPADVV